ncbi:MAG: Cna B-type domain-containing protein [Oscillospiraceae bacterium]
MRNKRRFSFKALASFCLSACMMIAASLPAMAASDETESARSETTINLICKDEEQPVVGFEWSAFRVLDLIGGQYTLVDDFADADIDLSDLSEDNMSKLAVSFDTHAASKNLSPLQSVATGDDGVASFSLKQTGLYLFTAKPLVKDIENGQKLYTPSPVIVHINLNNVNTTIDVNAKFTVNTDIVTPTEYKVTKYWKDEADSSKRPKSITAQIFSSDGSLYKEVELSADNNWTYTWSTDTKQTWKVAEKTVPDNYKVSYYTDGNTTYTIENDYEKPPESSQPVVPQTVTPSGPIPQTGLLWWPVLVLSLIGITLVVVGLKLYSSSKKETNE